MKKQTAKRLLRLWLLPLYIIHEVTGLFDELFDDDN